MWLLVVQACDSGPETGVGVVRYDGPPVTAESVGGPGTWSATVDILYRQVELAFTEADGSVRHRLTFIEPEGALPAFSGYRDRPASEQVASLRSGTIQIQQFDLDGELSGRFEGTLSSPLGVNVGTVFGVDVSGER